MKRMMSIVVLICFAVVARAETLTMLDGKSITGDVRSIDGEGRVMLAGGGRAVNLRDLRAIERVPGGAHASLFVQRLYLADGSVLIARQVTMSEGTVKFNWIGGEGATLAVDQVKGILLVPLSSQSEGVATAEQPFVQAVADTQAKADQLLAIGNSGLTAVPGALQTLDDEQARFVWNGEARKVERGKIYGIALAGAKGAADLTDSVRVSLDDGSMVWGKVAGLADGKLTLTRPGGRMTLPWEKVMAMRVRSGRMMFLSDMEATEQRNSATVTYAWPMRKDATALGGPLVLGGQRFEQGLGVHARSELTYDLGGDYRQFAATIGLDDSAPGEGDCVFVVKGDGKQLLTQHMKAGEAGEAILVDVSGVKKLELIVAEGENLDVGDLADWADARVIK